MTRNVAALDDVINGLNGAAAAGDADMLQATRAEAERITATYARLQKLDPEQAAALGDLRKEFDAYYTIA